MSPNTADFRGRSEYRVAVAVAVGGALGILTYLSTGSAQRVLEILALGQASLLAIVLSVSLLSVQVSSSQYAPMLSRVYRDGLFDVIMARFGVSILAALAFRTGLSLLSHAGVSLGVGVAVGLATWSFLSLFTLEERLLAFLNPDPILDQLVKEVSLSRYRAFVEQNREEGRMVRNPLLEIFQIAQNGIDQNDNYSALRAVDALTRATLQVVDDVSHLSPDEQRAAAEQIHRLFDYWVQITRATVERGADDVLHALVDGLADVGERAIADTDPEIAEQVVHALAAVCEHIHDGGRLEPRYLDAFTVFSTVEDAGVARTVADSAVDLADAGADTDALAAVLAVLVEAGHRAAVSDALARETVDADRRQRLRTSLDERVESVK